ncbi:MAG: hypothetical protein FWG56_05570 [Desulfovibrionaceae bacterium]|nr:hypothetical protein [Desulfovibrionaceae bacterium]
MRLHTVPCRFTGHRFDARLDPAMPTRRAEAALAAAVLLLALLAALLPATALPAGYHDFADQRAWLGLPHAMDVLTNLPFAVMGVWGLVWLRRLPAGGVGAAPRALAGVFFGGLLLTTLCSSIYHWTPGDAGLCIDRLGMSLAFAGLLGLAAADRIGARAGLALAALVTIAAPASALIAWAGNMTPWAVLQGGGLALLAALALRQPRGGALGFSIGAVIAFYALAKALELADQPVFALTQGWLSGHSAKHVAAALAAWPVVRALTAQCAEMKF